MPTNNDFHIVSGSVYGNYIGGNIANKNIANNISANARPQANQDIYSSEQKQTLAEAAKEIQKLLEQLAKMNPNPTEAEKIEYVNDETSPSFKRRAVRALQAGGEAAIEEFLDNPYVNVGKAIVKGWIEPEWIVVCQERSP